MPCFFIVLLHSPYVPVFSATKSITLLNFEFAITSLIFLILGGIPSTANLQQVTSADSFICLPSLTLNPSPALYMTVRSTTLRCCKFDKKTTKYCRRSALHRPLTRWDSILPPTYEPRRSFDLKMRASEEVAKLIFSN